MSTVRRHLKRHEYCERHHEPDIDLTFTLVPSPLHGFAERARVDYFDANAKFAITRLTEGV